MVYPKVITAWYWVLVTTAMYHVLISGLNIHMVMELSNLNQNEKKLTLHGTFLDCAKLLMFRYVRVYNNLKKGEMHYL